MCIRDRPSESYLKIPQVISAAEITNVDAIHPGLSLIHISEPTRLGMISYAVFCLKQRPPRLTPLYSSAASDVYKRQTERKLLEYPPGDQRRGNHQCRRHSSGPVSYTHLRAHETRHDLVCRLLLETATPKTYTSLFVGSVRCV